jgi:Protein of unknown function (DUF2845)
VTKGRVPMRWVCLLIAFASLPAHGMRCGTALVTTGQWSYEVLERCGPPVEQHVRTQYLGFNDGLFVAWPVVVEEWIYDLGPHRLRRRLLFEDGLLIQIDTLDRGVLLDAR